MAVDNKNVYIGKPEQSVTGAVATAAAGTAVPANAKIALSSAWTASGYVSEDGVTFSQDRSTTNIKDWSGANIRTLLDEFTGTIQYAEAETTYETMCRMVGSANVTYTAATTEHGAQMKVGFGPDLPPAQAFCFSMKDEDRRMRLVVPNGQVTAVDSVSFTRNDIVKWSFTITANDDGTGHSMYLLTDDGEVVAVVTPEVTLNHSHISVAKDSTFQLKASATPDDEIVTWAVTTGDTYASVDENGVVTGLAAGSAEVTATITVNTVDYTDTCSVTVTA